MRAEQKRFKATVDRVEDDVVVLDVNGHALEMPRVLLPGEVREGAGFVITVRSAPEVSAALERSVRARLAALTRGKVGSEDKGGTGGEG